MTWARGRGVAGFRWPPAGGQRILGGMLSHEEFLTAAIDVARQLRPEATIQRGEAFNLLLDGQVVFLENVYRKAAAEPAACRRLLAEFLGRVPDAAEMARAVPPYPQVQRRILPQIFPRDKLVGQDGVLPLVTADFPNDTVVVYVIDEPEAYRSIRTMDLQRWSVDAETVHRQALENLTQRSTGVRVNALPDEQGNILAAIFQEGDSYDSSRLLLPGLHENLRPVLGSPFLAGIPNRDFLICFRSGAGALHERLAGQIAEDHARMPYPISEKLFLVTADGVAAYRDELPGQQ